MSERVELTILRNLFFNEDFTRKVTPFIKPDYFTSRDERILFEEVEKFIIKYKNSPTKEAILIELGKSVCIWPEGVKEKDINDMVQMGKSPSKIKKIIDKNTFTGLEASLKLTQWRKV